MNSKTTLKRIYCSFYVLTAVFGAAHGPSAAAMPVNYSGYAAVESYKRTTFEKKYSQKLSDLEEQNYLPLESINPQTEYRPIDFVVLEMEVDNPPTEKFLQALVDEKANIMQIYGIDNDRYNEFAQMAVGILGNESKFFNSPKYQLKSSLPDPLVFTLKIIHSTLNGRSETTPLSHGPTFIKEVPKNIAEFYGILSPEELDEPFKAAVATVGYLADTYQELLIKIKHYDMTCVNEENFSDMLLYLYFGSASYRRDLINCNVTPDRNLYVKNYREYRKKVIWLEQAY